MSKLQKWFKKPVVWIVTAVIVVGAAAGICCAVALGGRESAEADSRTDSAGAVLPDRPVEGEVSAPPEDEVPPESTADAPQQTAQQPAAPSEPGEDTASYTVAYPDVVEHARYQGIYPNGVPILSRAQVESITPSMTWRQIYEGFGLQKAFPNGIAFGVEGNRLLLLDWENPDAPCARTGTELLHSCLDLWREDTENGRFVTFSDAVGILTYDPESGKILFGEWTVPTSEGTVTYDTDTGKIRYAPPASSAPTCIFDENQNPLAAPEICSGRQGFAKFSSLYPEKQQNGLLGSATIARLTLLDAE